MKYQRFARSESDAGSEKMLSTNRIRDKYSASLLESDGTLSTCDCRGSDGTKALTSRMHFELVQPFVFIMIVFIKIFNLLRRNFWNVCTLHTFYFSLPYLCLFSSISFYPSIYPSIRLYIYPYIYKSICLNHLSIYLTV